MGPLLTAYRRALGLLPPGFRREWGAAMVAEARDTLERAAAAGGGWARVAAARRLAVDLLATAGREWGAVVADAGASREGVAGVARDLRFALRSFRRAPLFTALVVGTLSVAIGADTALFSVVDAVLLRPLPYPDADRLVVVWPERNFSRGLLEDLTRDAPALDDVAGVNGARLTFAGDGEPAELFGAAVTTGWFATLGARPALGRTFTAEDGRPGAEPVVVLSHALWTDRFGADPGVVGSLVDLQDGDAPRRRVVGVMPASHRPYMTGTMAWIPVVLDPAGDDYRTSSFMTAVARRASGVDLAVATADVRRFARRARDAAPGDFPTSAVETAGVTPLATALVGDLRPRLLALLAAVGLVLLVACLNVTNLLLARMGGRARELAVRRAVGAGSGRLARQVLGETVLLAAAGGVGGVLLASLGKDVLATSLPGVRAPEVALDGRVLLFTALVSLGCGLVSGVVAGWAAAAAPPGAALAGSRGATGAREGHRVQRILVAGEVALALVAVFAAALLVESVRRVTSVETGFDPRGAVVFRVTAPPAAYPDDDALRAWALGLRDRLAAVPGVRVVGATSRMAMSGGSTRSTVLPEGLDPAPGEAFPLADFRAVTAGYAEAMGFHLREGRLLGPVDEREGPLAAVVNRAFAARFWPDGAVGREIRDDDGIAWARVVGVVDDVREEGLGAPPYPAMYVPYRDWPRRSLTFVVRSPLPPETLLPALKAAVWEVSPGVPVADARPLEAVVAASVRSVRLTARLFALFGGLTLLLGAVGVYGVVACAVAERRREFGIRRALGAGALPVARQAMAAAMKPVLWGLAAGTAMTPLAGRLLAGILHDTGPLDPGALVFAAALLAAVGAAATWIPVRRATVADPAEVMRAG